MCVYNNWLHETRTHSGNRATFSPSAATANADVEGGRRSSQGITKVGCCTEDLCNAATTLGIGPAAAAAFGICSALLFAHLAGNMG